MVELMTYRVICLTCTQCNGRRRVRVVADSDPATYPACPDCGWVSWVQDDPITESIEEAVEIEYEQVSMAEFNEFLVEFGQRQSEYLGKQFEMWKEERAQQAETQQGAIQSATNAMYRELWKILEHLE
jgi:hypothetical protein